MKRLVSAFALACTAVLAASNSALADSSRLVRVSSGDPFANCIIGGNGSGRSYRSAEVEPWIADNPANAANLVGVWQQDRWSDGGDGTVYSVRLPFDPLIARADTLDPSDDKESVTADPNRPGWAYTVWDRLEDIFPPCPAAGAAVAGAPIVQGHDRSQRQSRAARATAQAAPAGSASPCPGVFTGPTFFSRTTDGGKTWSKPRPIVPTGGNEQTIGNVIVANTQTGALFDLFNFINAAGENNIQMVVSTDHGAHWSARH